MTVTRIYAVSAPSYRVVQWLAEAGLIRKSTQATIVELPRCVVHCTSSNDQLLVGMALSLEEYGLELDDDDLVADEVWHDDIAHSLNERGLSEVAQVFSFFRVSLQTAIDHQTWVDELDRKGIAFGIV